jgi:drug/metabolite transporter (DMT)-like permease
MREARGARVWLSIATVLVLWASAFAGIKAGLTAYGPGQVALLRFGTASLVLVAYATAVRMRLPARQDLPRLALAGITGITIYHVALNFGEMSVSAGAASLLIAAGPVFTALLSVAFLGERLRWLGWVGIGVSFAGVALISFGEGGGFAFEPGALLILLSAVSTSIYFIVSKEPLTRYSAIEMTSYAIWLGTLPMLVFLPGLLRQLPEAPASATIAVIYLGVFPGAIAYVLWSYALARMPASLLATFLYISPALAIAIAWMWIGEVPTLITLVGGTLAVAGVIVVNTLGSGGTQREARLEGAAEEPGP